MEVYFIHFLTAITTSSFMVSHLMGTTRIKNAKHQITGEEQI